MIFSLNNLKLDTKHLGVELSFCRLAGEYQNTTPEKVNYSLKSSGKSTIHEDSDTGYLATQYYVFFWVACKYVQELLRLSDN